MTEVMIVDDDAAIRETLRLTLEDAGYTVKEEKNGLDALKHLQKSQHPMIVLLDLMMPGLSGAGVLGAIAEDSRLIRKFAFILITANHKTLTLALANLLVNLEVPVISKPWDVDQLLQVVASAAQRLNQGR